MDHPIPFSVLATFVLILCVTLLFVMLRLLRIEARLKRVVTLLEADGSSLMQGVLSAADERRLTRLAAVPERHPAMKRGLVAETSGEEAANS